MAWNTGNVDINKANERLENAQKTYLGESGSKLAYEQGQAGANAVGQNVGQNTAQTAASQGASAGEAEVLGQNAANVATQNAIPGEVEKVAEANKDRVEQEKNKLKEAEAEAAERSAVDDKVQETRNGILTAAGTIGGAAVGSALPGLGTAAGAALGGALGTGLGKVHSLIGDKILNSSANSKSGFKRGLGRIGGWILSDERAKEIEEKYGYHSKIKNKRLLEL